MEGVVFRVNSATQFVLLVQKTENLLNVPSGSFVTVAANPSTVQFGIDAGDLPVDASLFASGADQHLEAGSRQSAGSRLPQGLSPKFPRLFALNHKFLAERGARPVPNVTRPSSLPIFLDDRLLLTSERANRCLPPKRRSSRQ